MHFHRNDRLLIPILAPQTDLKRHMDTVKNISTDNVKTMLHQLVAGIGFCHNRRILHRSSSSSQLSRLSPNRNILMLTVSPCHVVTLSLTQFPCLSLS